MDTVTGSPLRHHSSPPLSIVTGVDALDMGSHLNSLYLSTCIHFYGLIIFDSVKM